MDANSDLYAALKGARLMLYAWREARKNFGLADDHNELNECIGNIETALARAARKGNRR